MKRTSIIARRPNRANPLPARISVRPPFRNETSDASSGPSIIVIQKGEKHCHGLNSINSVRDTFHSNSCTHPLCYIPLVIPHQQPERCFAKSMKDVNDVSRNFNLIFSLPRILSSSSFVPRVIELIIFRPPFVPFPPFFHAYSQSCTASISGISSPDTFKRQYHSAWYVNLLASVFLSAFQRPRSPFTIHFYEGQLFFMHDSRRKSGERGLVSPISGTDWVIRIYRRNTRFLSADCRRYRIRFDKLHSLLPFLSFPFLFLLHGGLFLPFLDKGSPIVRLFDPCAIRGGATCCCFDKQYTEISSG